MLGLVVEQWLLIIPRLVPPLYWRMDKCWWLEDSILPVPIVMIQCPMPGLPQPAWQFHVTVIRRHYYPAAKYWWWVVVVIQAWKSMTLSPINGRLWHRRE